MSRLLINYYESVRQPFLTIRMEFVLSHFMLRFWKTPTPDMRIWQLVRCNLVDVIRIESVQSASARGATEVWQPFLTIYH